MSRGRFAGLPRPGDDRYHPGVRPRDASSLVVLRRGRDGITLLMGRRHQRHRFMPGALVFPGGRVDPGDHRVPTATRPDPRTMAMLTASGPGGRGVSPARARALIVAAIRETFEETGLVIGQPAKPAPAGPGAWEAFARAGLAPDAGGLVYFARAITPPGLRHRFDTRFFLCEEAAISATLAPASDELEGITWCTPAAAKAGRIAGITALIVDVVEAIAEGRRAPGEVTVFAPGRQLGLVVPVA